MIDDTAIQQVLLIPALELKQLREECARPSITGKFEIREKTKNSCHQEDRRL
jgi:hypothetical protein